MALGAPPTDVVAVTPTVADGTRASVSPSQLLFSQADWSEAQTVTVSGAAGGETSVLHAVSSLDTAFAHAIHPTVKVTVSATGQKGASPNTELVAQMYEWRNDPRWSSYKAHTDRWDRALLALGETVSDGTLTPMTAAEAQAFVDQGWTRWETVAEALKEIESAGNQSPPAPTATATVSLSVLANPVAEGSAVAVTAELSTELPSAMIIPLTVTRDTSEDGGHGTLSGIPLPAGFKSGTGTITTTDDVDADNETFTVALGSPLPPGVTAGNPSSVTITITDDDTTHQQSRVPYVPPDPDPQTGNQNPVDQDPRSGVDPGESLLTDQDTPSGDEPAQEDGSPVLAEGGPHSDMVEGTDGSDTIYGYGGHDVIYGGEGNDELHTGSGNDRLFGDSGADRFVVSSSDTGDKRVADFNRRDGDRIVLKTEDGADDWPLKSDIIASASGTVASATATTWEKVCTWWRTRRSRRTTSLWNSCGCWERRRPSR